MDDFPGLLARDFGLRPQGKGAPMAPLAGSARSNQGPAFDDVFGGPPRFSQPRSPPSSFDSLFPGLKDPPPASKSSSLPVYDKPVYDDDIFDGVPGVRSSASAKFDDVFASMGSHEASAPPMGDFLESLGRPPAESKGSGSGRIGDEKEDLTGFDELIPGFGGSSVPRKRESPEASFRSSSVPASKSATNVADDPFVILETSTSANPSPGLFSDPLEQISSHTSYGSSKINDSSVSGGLFDDLGAFSGVNKSTPPFTSGNNEHGKDESVLKHGQNKGHNDPFADLEPQDHFSSEMMGNTIPKMSTTDGYQEQNHKLSEKRSTSPDPFEDLSRSGFQSSDSNARSYEQNAKVDPSPTFDETLEAVEDIWLTVSEIPLFTQPTSAPPPSRSPPSLVIKQGPSGKTDRSVNSKRKDDKSSSQFSPRFEDSIKNSRASTIEELEDFVMGKPQTYPIDRAEVLYGEDDFDRNSVAAASAAAMKEAMDKAEARFKHAKEVRERERDARSSRSKETAQQERDGRPILDPWDLGQEKQERLNNEREQREREEKEKEERRLEKERELELEREREKARQAVERATREARERAAAEARSKAERAAVEKANAEARQRAERAAVQRAANEARERAAAEARQKAEKVAAEARERAAAEARIRAERAAVEKVTAEARERAAAEAREKEARERAAVERAAGEARLRAERAAVERAAAEARERAAAQARERAAAEARQKQQKNDDDLESFFNMGARANSAPKQRAMPSENFFDAQVPRKAAPDAAQRSSSTSSTIRKASSATNIVDDLSSIFGAAPSSGEFQEVEGETEERRRARFERHQRTLERTAKALAEKNERDMQTKRDQEERHRIAETLDIEIKRWAAGKEGNLRALLSTLQYVLWPECGWQPVSLTDLIIGASVKKVYRKATLCIHPDKVQQKGANLQQKYIAEKVFDLLKEAWNKFNSEELF
ncbi:DnaJ domain-containing protein [Dioscorea alata]|uniref:DnaJ domain-containing protein n=1 Tax=Dioscorea alata TaxID=55571 RepID=A0ACB7U406_DIOAL|nr:DnaJ domain-containing protein [Dioscorea alata]